MDWLGAPDQGVGSSPLRPLGRNGEEIELTVSPIYLLPQPCSQLVPAYPYQAEPLNVRGDEAICLKVRFTPLPFSSLSCSFPISEKPCYQFLQKPAYDVVESLSSFSKKTIYTT
jgi:hypothetical protein